MVFYTLSPVLLTKKYSMSLRDSTYSPIYIYLILVVFLKTASFNCQLGHLDQFETEIPNNNRALDELNKWYQLGSGYPEAVSALKDFITKSLIPDLQVLSVHSGSCVTAQVLR